MGSTPIYGATVNIGAVLTNASADTSTTAPTNVATIFTAGASGSRVEEIRATQILTTSAASRLNIFLHDGSTYHLLEYLIVSIGTISTTAGVSGQILPYTNLVLPTGWSIRVTNTVANGTGATAATHKLFAFGENF